MNKKSVVGIVPTAKLFKDDNPYADNYIFVNSYIKRLEEAGAIALGIVSVDGYINQESLALCDSFLICGGLQIYPYHFQVADYAIKHKKRLLGICLGLQVIHSYFTVLNEAKKRNYSGDLLELYMQMKKENHMFVLPVEHHWDVAINRSNIEDTKHKILLNEGSHIAKLLKADVIYGSSMHKYAVNTPCLPFVVSGKADDGSIEAMEYSDLVIAVQFHPEVDSCFLPLFEFLA